MHPNNGLVVVTAIMMLVMGSSSVAQGPTRTTPASLAVLCVDDAGRPIENAEVRVFELSLAPKLVVTTLGEPLRSGADGACTPIPITGLETWREHWVYARAANRFVGMQSTGLFGRRDGKVTVRLGPSRQVNGTVRAPAGADITAVRIRVSDLWQPGTEVNDPTALPTLATSRSGLLAEVQRVLPGRFESSVAADGTFHLDEVPASLRLSLEAVGPGLAQTQWRATAEDNPEVIAISMPAEAVFSGTTSAPDGQPAVNATVTLQQARMPAVARGFDPASFVATTAADGRFEIRGLPAGEFVLSVQTDAGCHYPQRLNLAAAEHRTAENLHLERGVEVSGCVLAADDKSAIANVTIVVAGDPTRFLSDTVMARVRSDSDGRFTIRVPKGPAWLTPQPRRPFVGTDPIALDLTLPAEELRRIEIMLPRK